VAAEAVSLLEDVDVEDWPVKEPKPHPATDVELQGAMVGIVVALGVGLNMEQSVTNVSEEGVSVLQKSVDCRRARRGWLVRQQCRRRATINHLKWRGAQGGVEGGVVAVFGPWEPVKPSSGMITCDVAQVHGNRFVDHL
jgi:hypothetical protein